MGLYTVKKVYEFQVSPLTKQYSLFRLSDLKIILPVCVINWVILI